MRKVCLGVLPLFILGVFILLVVNSQDTKAAVSKTVKDQVNTYSSEDEDVGLGDGAYVDWSLSGYSVLGTEGVSPIGSVVIHGAQGKDLNVRVKLRARIGSIKEELKDIEVVIPADRDYSMPLNLNTIQSLHPKQYEYTTKITGWVQVIPENDDQPKYSMSLPQRFLAYNQGGDFWEVMDFETREELYPYGFTTTEGQKRVQEILAETPEGEFIEAIGPGI